MIQPHSQEEGRAEEGQGTQANPFKTSGQEKVILNSQEVQHASFLPSKDWTLPSGWAAPCGCPGIVLTQPLPQAGPEPNSIFQR